MKILVLADIDDFHWAHGEGRADAVLSCGDVPDRVILEAAQAHHCSLILAVKGNHDSSARFPLRITDLHLHTVKSAGLTFGGLNGSWRYKPRGNFLYDQAEAQRLLEGFPPVDVFLSHNSPSGVHDREDEVHHGFQALNDYIRRARPGLVVHGHQHVNVESHVGETRIVGVFGHRLLEA